MALANIIRFILFYKSQLTAERFSRVISKLTMQFSLYQKAGGPAAYAAGPVDPASPGSRIFAI
ncbi:MAG: hypothetical protein H7257_09405 [Taibaiella sp.]|nr:hypothetical protein [Taibaiella sp.]